MLSLLPYHYFLSDVMLIISMIDKRKKKVTAIEEKKKPLENPTWNIFNEQVYLLHIGHDTC